jgi:hypothetical protein
MRDDISLIDILFIPCVLGWNAKQYHSLIEALYSKGKEKNNDGFLSTPR